MIDKGQKNRVLLVGAIKTGNHWCRFVVRNYFNILNNNASKTLTFRGINSNQIGGVNNKILDEGILFDHDLPFVKYCHSFFFDCVDSDKFYFVFDKFVYLIRNPFDMMISWFYYDIRHEKLLKVINSMNLKEIWFFDDFVKQRLRVYINHISANLPYANLVLNYDKLREDPSDFRKLISLFTEKVDEDVLKKAIEMSSFESIKKMEDKVRTQENLKEVAIMARKGTSGQYKDVMKPELIEFIKTKWKKAKLSDEFL